MDETTLIAAAASAALALLVYLMWKAATRQEWHDFTASERHEWRSEEERLKEEKRK